MKQELGRKVVHIATLDTGCDTNHEFFNGISLNNVCVEGLEDAVDRCGHGTFSVSVIVDTMKQFEKVTYKLTSIKVSDQGSVNINLLNKGLKYCKRINPDVIYIGSCNCSFNAEMASLLNDLKKDGTIIIVPSGNYNFDEPTYPACLETTLCCGLLNQDGSICTEVNTYNVDAFVGCSSNGVLSKQYAQSMGIELTSDGRARLEATSFSAAELTAFVSVIKAYGDKIDVYWIRNFIQKKCKKRKILNYKKLLLDIKDEDKNNANEIEYTKTRYIVLKSPRDMDMSKDWNFSLHTYDGAVDTSSGILRLELYDDRQLKHKVYEISFSFKQGGGRIPINDTLLKPGVYMMRLGNKGDCIESVLSMMISIPAKPNVVCENGLVSVTNTSAITKILYTENNDMPMVTVNGNPVGETKIYTGPIRRNKETLIFCSYCNNIFSQPVILKEMSGGQVNES